ncbi:hypothetical protein IR123_03310 [Streptococcus sp. 19428wC2_LYSM12]|uniref:hypothetical protein n=1 Tax=unclassified Streptococcus TaxID=2608887 RepID=UPI001071FCE9|nr:MULTISPECIES: hypothetical protein [unclassified Streptococcus]MBF0786935.1 hypothetical protein [Streptococcus sp. 19428wC2_LYSM12]TFV06136.1 hypothetical protein E4T79_03305 [Streptococcus sp. LYSM12]
MSQKNKQLGYFGRKKQAFDEYVLVTKAKMKAERDYFASEGESDSKRLAAQKARDQEFLESLRKVGVGFIIFLIFYALIRTILGLW